MSICDKARFDFFVADVTEGRVAVCVLQWRQLGTSSRERAHEVPRSEPLRSPVAVVERCSGRPVKLAIVALVLAATAPIASEAPVANASSIGRHPGVRGHLTVSSHRVAIDEKVRIGVRGLPPGALVTVSLTFVAGGATFGDGQQHQWTSQADFRADRHGRVDLRSDAPVSGSYAGVDPMGLFWSAHSTTTPAPEPRTPWTDEVHLSATMQGRQIDETDIVRYYLRPGARSTPVRGRGLVGTLFTPRQRVRHPAMIVFGGSEGGKTVPELQAAYLASHGYTALALSYFGDEGVPSELSLIPLEYFGTAIDWLADQPSVNPNRIGVRGGSRWR